MEFRSGGLIFTSKFDSGNLARVEKVSKDEDDEDSGPRAVFGEVKADYEFNVWTRPDCAGTPYENGNRSWFNFGVRGYAPNRLIKINIMNLNRQGKLYSQGHMPFVKTVPGRPKWERTRDKPYCETVDGNFYLSFTHRFHDVKNATTYFAFCYPWSYEEQQARLSELDQQFQNCHKLTTSSPPDSIYYHRELLCSSLDGNRVDLVTVSDLRGLQRDAEPRFDSKLFPDTNTPRCRAFKGKRVMLVSSRVHPGETPASFVFNGFLDFVVSSDDPRAKALRRNFVIKMIPILNPDGVIRGHYRTDARGVNLNRMYLDPDFDMYPSIYASKSVLCYHHVNNRVTKPAPVAAANTDKGHFETTAGAYNRTQARAANVNNNGASSQSATAKHTLFTERKTASRQGPAGPRPNLNQTFNVVYSSNKTNAKTRPNLTSASESTLNIENIEDVKSPDAAKLAASMGKLSVIESVQTSVRSSVEIPSAGEFDDPDDDDGIGNEGSDEEGTDFTPNFNGTFQNAPHLSDPKLREIPADESGIAFYVDLHGHASKRGCFIYGNYFEAEELQVENMLFPKLIALNTAHFDFTGCNFTERNMYAKDKKDGLSKEGAGRVAIYKALGILHSYTLECNYNTGRMVNAVPPAYGDNGRATPPPLAGFPPKYTQAHYEEVGKALGMAALDMIESNPWSRLVQSEYASVHGVRDWVRRYVRGLRGLPRGAVNRPQRAAAKANSAQTSHGTSSFRGPPRTAFSSGTLESPSTPAALNRSPYRRNQAPSQQRKELAPVRDAPRGAYQRVKRTQSTSSAAPPSGSGTAANAPTLRHSLSTPVTLQLTSCTDTQTVSRQSSADTGGRRPIKPFLAPCGVVDAQSVELQSVTSLSAASSNRQSSLATTGKVNSQALGQSLRVKKPSPPVHARSSGYHSDSVLLGLTRQLSTDSSIHELEEEKIQQLKNIPTAERGAQSRASKLEAPNPKPVIRLALENRIRTEQAKRRGGKVKVLGGGKRRSSSYSPTSGKGPRKLGSVSTTDSESERKGKARRKKGSGRGGRKKAGAGGSPQQDDDERPGLGKEGETLLFLRPRTISERSEPAERLHPPGGIQVSPRATNTVHAPRDYRAPHSRVAITGEAVAMRGGAHAQTAPQHAPLFLESVPEAVHTPLPLEPQPASNQSNDTFWIEY